MKKLTTLFLLFVFVVNAFATRPDVSNLFVTHVVDGDTFKGYLLKDPEKTIVTYRIMGVDAPELAQPYGEEAKEYLAKLILNKRCYVIEHDVDVYGRVLCEIGIDITKDARDIGSLLVGDGFAWAYLDFDNITDEKKEGYQWLQTTAKMEKIGLWKEENPMRPSEYRKQRRQKKAA